MTNGNAKIVTLLSLLAFAQLGCDAEHESAELESFRTGGQTQSGGGMWINNAFIHPQVGGIDPAFSLGSPQGLATDQGLLLDPDAHDTVQALVECALPPGHSIIKEVEGELLEFEGQLGLAPEWEDDACDEDCQEWVSACLLARSNPSGQNVSVWMRADHPAIGEGTSPLYPTYEASFFGNLFAETAEQHYCQGIGGGPLLTQLEARTCAGSPGPSCEFVRYTACQARARCTFSKGGPAGSPAGHSPKNCIGGSIMNGHPYHTITTYVGPT